MKEVQVQLSVNVCTCMCVCERVHMGMYATGAPQCLAEDNLNLKPSGSLNQEHQPRLET